MPPILPFSFVVSFTLSVFLSCSLFCLDFRHSLCSRSIFFIWPFVCEWPTIRFWFFSKCSRTHITTRQDRPENSTEFMSSNLYPDTHTTYMCAMKARVRTKKNIAETLPAFRYPYKYAGVIHTQRDCKKSESHSENQNAGWQRNIGNTSDKLKGKATKNVIPSQAITPFVECPPPPHKITYAGTHQPSC